MEKKPDGASLVFAEQEKQNLAAYLDTLKRIHIRLLIEGHRIVDGEIVRPYPRQHDETESQS
jgi:hypothetical protein